MSTHGHAASLGLGHHDHVCGFYYTAEERDSMLLPFLGEGIRDGSKCVAVVDSTPPDVVVASIPGADAAVESGQFEIYHSDETYLRTGTFEPELTIDFWETRAKELVDDSDYDFIRLTGELSWLDRADTPREDIVRYESWADRFVLKYPMTILCLYDLRRLGSSVLMDLMRTHPKLLMGGLLLENPHHISSDEFSTVRE
jgi:hypothetical protein